jgi:hypothetical protein
LIVVVYFSLDNTLLFFMFCYLNYEKCVCVLCGHLGHLLDSYFLNSTLTLSNLLSAILPFEFYSLVYLKAFLMSLLFLLKFSLCNNWCNFTCSFSCIFLSLFLQMLLSSWNRDKRIKNSDPPGFRYVGTREHGLST